MKCFSVLIGFVTVLFVVLAQAQQGNTVVAEVGPKKITLDEFNRKYNEVRNQTQNPPTKDLFLEDLVRFELGVQEAEKKKLQNDPIVQENMRKEIYKALLEKDLGDRVQKITVSEKEMADYYKKNPEIRTSHILIEIKADATPAQRAEAKKRADEIAAEVKKSKRPFEELVRLYSDDTLSKQTGGDTGWVNRLTVVPAYYNPVLAAKVGDIIGPVDTLFGFHIIKVTGRRAYENANKRQVRMAVFDEKRRDIFDGYFDRLKKGTKIQVNKNAIK